MKIPTFGPQPTPGLRYIRRPGAYAILPRKNLILATFQGGIHQEFQLPGGGIDEGESPISALHREVFEETGWSISRPRLFFRFRRFVFMPEYQMFAEKICSIFVAQPILKIDDPSEPDHLPMWLNQYAALDLLAVNGDKAALNSFLIR